MNKHQILVANLALFVNEIEAIYLYGSVARGEQDELSDIDLLIVSDLKPSEIIGRLDSGLGSALENQIEVLSRNKLNLLFSAGSDFALTIFLDAKLLFSSPSHLPFLKPAPHIISQDFLLSQFSKLKECESVIGGGTKAIGFECGQIYSALRRVYISQTLQARLYSSRIAINAIETAAMPRSLYDKVRLLVRRGKFGFRDELPSSEWVLNLIADSINWILAIASEYGFSFDELHRAGITSRRASEARNCYRKIIALYAEAFDKIPPPFTLSAPAVSSWCKDAYNAGYGNEIELYRFSMGDLLFKKNEVLLKIEDILSRCERSKYFDRYMKLVLKP